MKPLMLICLVISMFALSACVVEPDGGYGYRHHYSYYHHHNGGDYYRR